MVFPVYSRMDLNLLVSYFHFKSNFLDPITLVHWSLGR